MTDTIDLGAARAARREGRGEQLAVRLGDDLALALPGELPVDVFSPLKRLDIDDQLGLLFQAEDREKGERLLRDLLTLRPELAKELLSSATACLERLFCSCGVGDGEHEDGCQWPRFLAWRPSPQDYVELLRGLWSAYGANLGEAFAPAGSSGTGGRTSKRTSTGSTGSTRVASGRTPVKTGS